MAGVTEDRERVERVIAPLEGSSIAGDDLRADTSPTSLYFRLRDARSEARAAERLADNDPTIFGAGSSQWRMVADLACEALTTRTKDFEIAAWLTESLTRRDGLAGLAEGAMIMSGLVERFWDQGLYPANDPEEAGGRLAALTGLSGEDRDGSLLQPLRKIILFAREDSRPVAFWEYERARDVSAMGTAAQKSQAGDDASFDELDATAHGHGQAALVAVKAEAWQALAAWQTLQDVVERVVAGDALPATGRVRALLERLLRTIARYVPDEVYEPVAPVDGDFKAASADAEAGQVGLESPRRPQSRDGMLAQILDIAAIFRRNEPNSPLSYTLEDAVRRARLSWLDLLREVVPDAMPRADILSGLGIRPPPD